MVDKVNQKLNQESENIKDILVRYSEVRICMQIWHPFSGNLGCLVPN